MSKRTIYKLLKYSNDLNAIRRGKIGRRLARRVHGKSSGKLARKLFR